MLTFRNTNIVFAILLAGLIVLDMVYGLSRFYYCLLFIFYSLVLFWGCVTVSSNFFIKIICKARTDKKEIAISFDDGPVEHYTPAILNVLAAENVKATFFCIGHRVRDNAHLLQQVHQQGHIIGNHSFSHHFWFDMYSARKMQEDLRQMDAAMEKAIGLKPKLFRPPYGVTNPNLKKAIINGAYTPVGWSVRSMDTVTNNENKLLERINAGISPGAVFLFHDTCEVTLKALPDFIQEVKKRGYNIVPLDKLLHLQPYA